jgi:hypothetical protein
MQVKDVGSRDRFERGRPHDLVHGVPVAGELTFVAVAESARLDAFPSQTLDPAPINRDALDRARGGDRGDARLACERPQQLGELIPVESLPPATDVEPSQARAESNRLRAECLVEIDEASHPSTSANHDIQCL